MNPCLLALIALGLLAPAAAAIPQLPAPLQDRDCQLDCWAVRTVLGIAGEVPEPPLAPPGADPQQPSGPGGLAE